ncbi:hypothetical protein [Methylobacterium frigidaeris]|uniref:Uncharacterized protein n=1 Tax=Methylobacterium frigidaeris TaxID=2038277 RepID=A0AA37H9J5_9HYPH|nr:hypothetical protein [Methylobacterium frigidaeris]PIK73901.1 hypothetical protein CS379_05620 [Methylobacterium frigidaeris]GJD61872.1 hypothetical protein MPEAHAMD_2020 [Methylobacterium frigidaeris]
MRGTFIAASILVPLAATAAAATPCAEQIATIERRLESPGAAAVTGDAPTTRGSPKEALPKEASPKALAAPPAGKPSDPATAPQAGRIAEARGLIATARDQDRAGNAQACNDTMTRAKELIGALP